MPPALCSSLSPFSQRPIQVSDTLIGKRKHTTLRSPVKFKISVICNRKILKNLAWKATYIIYFTMFRYRRLDAVYDSHALGKTLPVLALSLMNFHFWTISWATYLRYWIWTLFFSFLLACFWKIKYYFTQKVEIR
jgi:hypothetical protein